MSRPRRVGLPWYEPEHYEELRASLADGATLPADYETWQASAEQVEGVVARSGVEVVRVPIEPNRFARWCTVYGLASNGAARARYAAEIIAEG